MRFLIQILKSQTGMHCPPPPPYLLINKSSKIPRVEDQTSSPPRVDTHEESKDRYQKIPSPTQETKPSAATRGKKKKKVTSEATPPWPLNRKKT